MSPDLDALVQELRDEAVYDPIRHRAADAIQRLHFDLQTNREEKQRAYRNRDMWKGQCERQSEELSRWRLRTSRDTLAKHLAALDGITLQDIRSTVGPAEDANNWREYLGRADDLLALISVEMAATPSTDAVRRQAREWQPIETAPHETNILLAWRDWSLPGQWRMEAGMASWGWRNEVASTMSRHGEATHWMPLPTPPAGADEGGKNGG